MFYIVYKDSITIISDNTDVYKNGAQFLCFSVKYEKCKRMVITNQWQNKQVRRCAGE